MIELTDKEVNIMSKALAVAKLHLIDGPFLVEVQGVFDRLYKSQLGYWQPAHSPAVVGDWVSICCQRDLHQITSEDEAVSLNQLSTSGTEVSLFSTHRSALRWFSNRDDQDRDLDIMDALDDED